MPSVPKQPPHTVFVSHAHADNVLCDRYVAALKQRGLDVWYDRTNMQDGHFLSEQISIELERRTAFIVLYTPASLASFWVRLEMQAYLDLLSQDPSRMLLPVRIADCTVPVLLRTLKYIDAVALGFDAAIDALAVALRAPSMSATPALAPAGNESADELVARGVALIEQDRHAAAIPFLQRASQRDPRSFDAWANLAVAYNVMERYDEALDACELALTLEPTNAATWFTKGTVLDALGRYQEALAAFEQSLSLDDTDAETWTNKGAALDRLKRYQEALVAVEHALTLDPKLAIAWHNKATVLANLGRDAEANAAMQRARALGWEDDEEEDED